MDGYNSKNKDSTKNSLIECLFNFAKKYPKHDAIITPTIKLSYNQLTTLIYKQVKILYSIGISNESVIGVNCANDVQHLILCLASNYIGATSCTVPTHELDEAQKTIIKCCGVTNIADEELAVDLSQFESNGEQTSQHASVAIYLFSTSGTTGDPKIVVLQDNDLVAQACRHIDSKNDRFACLASMEHNFVKRHRLYCVAMGATNVFLDNHPDMLVEQCQRLNVNVLHVSAFQAKELLAVHNIGEISGIRLKLGGSHVPTSLRQQLRKKITSNLQFGYGTTETGAIAFTNPNDVNAKESVGNPLPGVEVHVVSAERKALVDGELGELAVRCKGVFRQYLNNSNLTNARLQDNWFYTGDVGYIDQQKRIHLCGRSDDMFVFNSMNIYPQEIETQVIKYPGITDVAVLPKISSVHDNIPIALVVFAKKIKPNIPDLKKYVEKRVGIRSPRQYIIVDEIPRNASGKVSRKEAIKLPSKSDQIRKLIIQVLDADVTRNLRPSLISDFVKGDIDIRLRHLNLDSLSRMNLLIALEIEFDVVITPQEFATFRSLSNIVAFVLSNQFTKKLDQEECLQENSSINYTSQITNTQYYVINFFQRVFSYCKTVAQFYKALTTLEHRLTPLEIELLYEMNQSQRLIPLDAEEKFHVALRNWLQRIKSMMLDSGKHSPEPYVLHRISSTVYHFVGPGLSSQKKLLICFPEAGGRSLMMPNAVLMQHTDSSRYDLLIISEPLNESYRLGVPLLGKNVTEVIKWISKQRFIGDYNCIRTLGCSAGGYPAVIAGSLLNAELAVSVGGRFHKRRPIKILERIFITWRAVQKGQCSRVIMSYAKDTRDRKYAKIMAMLSGGSVIAVEFTNASIGHLFLQQLSERGELAHYLSQTIFSEADELMGEQHENVILSYPIDKINLKSNSQLGAN